MIPHPVRIGAALLGCALVLAACSTGEGLDLREPGTGGATPRTPTIAPSGFSLSSPGFSNRESLPDRYRHDRENISPALEWTGVPEGAVSLGILVTDLDAEGFVHWAVWGIDPTVTSLAEGELPPNAREGINDFGERGWGGPQPPGDGPHQYLFEVIASNAELDLVDGTPGRQAVAVLRAAALETASLFGVAE